MQQPMLGVVGNVYPAGSLKEAINALYTHDPSVQGPADAWLQTFRSTPGSYRVCLQLLESPNLQEHECYFATNNIKAACQKHQDILELTNLPDLLTKLAVHTQACLHKNQWVAAQQLAGAAASIAVRAVAISPNSMLQDLQTIFCSTSTAAAAATAAAATVLARQGSDDHVLLATASGSYALAPATAAAATLNSQTLGMQMQQEPVALAAMLLLLAALPDVALSKQTSTHPERRTAVTDSLKQNSWPAPILRAGVCSKNPKLISLACQAITSWCELGASPRNIEAQPGTVEALMAAVLVKDTAVYACDAAAAILTAIKESSSSSSATGAAHGLQLLHQMAQLLQGKVLPALAGEHRSMGFASVAAAGGATTTSLAAVSQGAADAAVYSAVMRSHFGPNAEASFCKVLCAAAAALLGPVLQGAVQYQPLLQILLQQLLLSVCVSNDGVAMMAVDFWQDCYLAILQGLPPDQQSTMLLQQRGVLEALIGALVRRTQLSPAAAAGATADARDLPEETRLVRRELASALRDISALLGGQAILSYITQLVGAYYQHLCSTFQAAAPAIISSRAGAPPTVISSSMGSGIALQSIAAGLGAGPDVHVAATGRWSPADLHAAQLGVQQTATVPGSGISLSAGAGHVQVAASSGSGTVSGSWLPLESALYAANVLLGRQPGTAADEQVQQLVQYATASITQPEGSMKLAGTALTLLGGLGAWFVEHPALLPAALAAAVSALNSADDKLSRNAATCIHRLTSCEDLAMVITNTNSQFVQQVLQYYQKRGGLSAQAADNGDDKSTEELLLLSLCSLAVAHTGGSSSDMDSILLQLVGPQLTAAAEELLAALQGNWPRQQQQQQKTTQSARAGLWPQRQPLPQQQQTQRQQQQQQAPVIHSTAVSCFKALTSLVAGLPTGTGKPTIGVPLHHRHPRHEQQLQEQQQQQAAAAAQQDVSAAAGNTQVVQGYGGSLDDGSFCSASSTSGSLLYATYGASGSGSYSTALSVGGTSSAASNLYRQTSSGIPTDQQQAPSKAAGGVAELRQRQACSIVSQLLVRASRPVMLALQAAAKAAGEHQALANLFAQQLLTATCNFLLVAFPAAVQHQVASARAPTGAGSSVVAHVGGRSNRSSSSNSNRSTATIVQMPGLGANSIGAAAMRPLETSSNTLQAGVLLQQLCQLLEQLPVALLQQSCCLQLLCSCVSAATAAGALPVLECLDTAALMNNINPMMLRATPQQQQLLATLQQLIRQALGAAAASILQQHGAADPEHTSAALALTTMSMQQCPAVLATNDLDVLLLLIISATKTYHLRQCTAVLDCIQVLAQAAYLQHQQHPTALSSGSAYGNLSPGSLFLTALRRRLEAGSGTDVVLSLLLAASGAMPPDIVLPVSYCLHSVWLSVGQAAFVSWLTAAVLQVAPATAPWVRNRHIIKVGFVTELTDASCLTDTTKFKRLLKSFCGGKKKGGR